MTEEQGYVVETARQMATHVGVLIGSVEQLAHEREQLRSQCERLERECSGLRESETVVRRERDEAAETLAELRCAYEALLQEYEAGRRELRAVEARQQALLRDRADAAERLEALVHRLAV
jgi:chromosome segregation ATPase